MINAAPPPQTVGSRDLFVRRVVVTGELSCDVPFRRGLNVVESELEGATPTASNQAGKTALVELIRYGLGRRVNKAEFHFASIADQLDALFLEVELGDETYVIERSLQMTSAAVVVRRGSYDPGGARTGGSTLSVQELSEWLLGQLAIPRVEVKTDAGELTPLTFPLLARAFLLHQEYSFGAILQRVQPEKRKTDIVGFLTGITPDRRYAVEAELATAQQAYEQERRHLRSVSRYLSERGVPTTLEAEARVEARQAALEEAYAAEAAVHASIRQESDAAADVQGRVEGVRDRLLALKDERAEAQAELAGRAEELDRLRELGNSLVQDLGRIDRLRTSSVLLSSVSFSSCPRCLQEVTAEMEAREGHGHCALCARPMGSTSDDVPVQAPRLADVEAQLIEVKEIIASAESEVERVAARLRTLDATEDELTAELDRAVRQFVSPSVDRLVEASRQIADRERDLDRAEALAEQAAGLNEVRDEVDRRREAMEALAAERRAVSKPREGRLDLFEQELDRVLRGIDFYRYERSRIDRSSLMPVVNGNAYGSFGLAYKGLIAVSYYLAMWLLSREVPAYMPRTLVVDSPAVGDLNEVSYERLLDYVAGFQNSETDPDTLDWQLILTTRRTTPALDPFVMLSLSSTEGRMLLRRTEAVGASQG